MVIRMFYVLVLSLLDPLMKNLAIIVLILLGQQAVCHTRSQIESAAQAMRTNPSKIADLFTSGACLCSENVEVTLKNFDGGGFAQVSFGGQSWWVDTRSLTEKP